MNTVEETKASLTSTKTPHPDFFMSISNGAVEIEIDLPNETNERNERRANIRILGPLDVS